MIAERIRNVKSFGVALVSMAAGAGIYGASINEHLTLTEGKQPVPKTIELSAAEFDRLQQDALNLLKIKDENAATLIFQSPEFLRAAEDKAEKQKIEEQNSELLHSRDKRKYTTLVGFATGVIMFGVGSAELTRVRRIKKESRKKQ